MADHWRRPAAVSGDPKSILIARQPLQPAGVHILKNFRDFFVVEANEIADEQFCARRRAAMAHHCAASQGDIIAVDDDVQDPVLAHFDIGVDAVEEVELSPAPNSRR